MTCARTWGRMDVRLPGGSTRSFECYRKGAQGYMRAEASRVALM